MAPARPGSSSHRRGTVRCAADSPVNAIENRLKRAKLDKTHRSFRENECRRGDLARVSKCRRGRTRRKHWKNCSSIRSRSLKLGRTRGRHQHTHSSTIGERYWYRFPPPEGFVPDMFVAGFYGRDLDVRKISVLDLSLAFDDLLEFLRRESEMATECFTYSNGGFTLDHSPWWYQILFRPEEAEDTNPKKHWELLADSDDYQLMKQTVILNPGISSIVFRHHKQMLHYGLSERTQAIMRQRVIECTPEEKEAVEFMIVESNYKHLVGRTSGAVDGADPMDLSET